MKTTVIIPARLESKRLNRKLLLPGPDDKPLLYSTWKRAKDSKANYVYIAADSSEIAHEAERFGANVIMTNITHNCGTSRIAEAYDKIELPTDNFKDDCIINLQGDEPEIRAEDINLLIDQFQAWEEEEHRPAWMKIVTLATPLYNFYQYSLPQNVKVVFDEDDFEAIYFSRGMIPWVDNLFVGVEKPEPIAYKHIGIYAYTAHMLSEFITTLSSRLERIEGLEQMRAIENSWPILVVPITAPSDDSENIWPLGINTDQDYKLWRTRTQI